MEANHQVFIQGQVRRFESACQSAAQQVRRARTIAEVIQAARVSSHPVVRAITRSLPCVKALNATVLARLDELIAEQIKAAAAEPDLEQRKQVLGRLRQREWEHLRGAYAMQWRFADREAHRLLAGA